MSDLQNKLATLADYVERSTLWKGGGATRHDAQLAINALPDEVEWIEKGLAEWRAEALEKARQLAAVQATVRIAVSHLQTVLNKTCTFEEQQRADTAARDWLLSISSEP